MTVELFGKGAIERAWDARNILFADIPLGNPVFDWNKGYDLSEKIPFKIEDQDGSSSCVGQSWAKYAETLEYLETGVYKDLSSKFIYSRIFIPPSGGAYIYKGASIMLEQGTPHENSDPSYQNGSAPSEGYMRIKNERPEVLTEAYNYRAKSHAYLSASIDNFALAILNQNGLVTGFLGSNQGVSIPRGFIRPPVVGEETWGHAVYCIGAKLINGKKYIKFINSWGTAWGDGGYGYIGEDYFAASKVFNAITLVDLLNPTPVVPEEMYTLVRSPQKAGEVYALKNKVVRHIANLQTLKLGDKEPDRLWKWEGAEIPVASTADWATYQEADEIHLDPFD